LIVPALFKISRITTKPVQVREAASVELAQFEAGRYAETRNLSSAFPAYGALTIAPLGLGACRLTQEFWVDLPKGAPVSDVRDIRDGIEYELRTLMSKLPGSTADIR
jgi:hypothetical protein